MGFTWDLNKIVTEIQKKALKENRAAGDVLQEVINKFKEDRQ